MKRLLLILSILFPGAGICRAQQEDPTKAIRLFMKVCNSYKQLPVQVDLDVVKTSNYVLDAADTGHIEAKFVLRREGTYIRFGEIEQIANDSLLLLVSEKIKRILIYSHRGTVAGMLEGSIGGQLKDSSVEHLAARYIVVMSASGRDTAEITISGKLLVQLTDLPRETIRVKYDPVTFQPYEIRQTKRDLVPLSAEEYRQSAAGANPGLLIRKDSSYYIVQEQLSVYRYDRIVHQADGVLPVTIADRIRKDETGKYQPVSKYEGYGVSREF